MKVLAFDPGYDRLGVALLEKTPRDTNLLFSDCLTSDKTDDFSERLAVLLSSVREFVDTHSPDCLALEKLFFNSNQKTAMRVAEVRGALIGLATEAQLPVFEYTPSQIKVAVTGYGKSPKEQVIAMVKRLVPMEKESTYDDEYDAIAVGLTHLAHVRPR